MPDLFIAPTKKTSTSKVVLDVVPTQIPLPGKPLPFFASYCVTPQGVTFDNQEDNEHVMLFIRQHFITNIGWMLTALFLFLLPTLLLFFNNYLEPFTSFIPNNFRLILLLFYYLIIFGFVFLNFVSWFYNVGVVTNLQIIDIDFTDIMYRNVAKTRINDVVDVEFSQGGFWHSFIDYGDVLIQTEGMKPNFEFHDVPNPGTIADKIIDLKGENTRG